MPISFFFCLERKELIKSRVHPYGNFNPHPQAHRQTCTDLLILEAYSRDNFSFSMQFCNDHWSEMEMNVFWSITKRLTLGNLKLATLKGLEIFGELRNLFNPAIWLRPAGMSMEFMQIGNDTCGSANCPYSKAEFLLQKPIINEHSYKNAEKWFSKVFIARFTSFPDDFHHTLIIIIIKFK